MMRRSVVRSALGPVFFLAALGPAIVPANAQDASVTVTGLNGQQRFTADQLDNLTGPVALYPDALLAQVLVAATFPDQIQDAAAFVRANGTDGIDAQSWDISVKAVAHYASALNTMADKLDWTTALGKAYASQSSEVMSSVQRLRAMAAAQGNLKSTEQQQVVQDNGTYEIAPTQSRVIYVPVYDPYIVYTQPIFNVGFSSRYWSFGVGFPIGSWLSYDCDWGLRRVYYNGWNPVYYGYAGGWRERARPYVRVTDIYISPRYRDVYVNHNVTQRYVDYRNVDRYASVHRGQHFDGRPDNRQFDNNDRRGPDSRGYDGRNGGSTRGAQGNSEQHQNGGDRSAHPRGDGVIAGDRLGNGAGSHVGNGDRVGSGDRVGNGNRVDGNGNRDSNGAGDRTGNRTGNRDSNVNGDRARGGNGAGTNDAVRGNGGANGSDRVPPQYRRREPGGAVQGQGQTEVVAPQRRGEAPANRDQQQQNGTAPVVTQPMHTDRGRAGSRFGIPEQRQAQPLPAPQAQPQPRQAAPQQQVGQPVPVQRAEPQREPRHEQQPQVRVQSPPEQQSAPPQKSAPPRGSDDRRGGERRGGDDRGRGH